MTSQQTEILESQLYALLDAVREHHGTKEIEREINEVVEDCRTGRFDDDDAFFDRMRGLLRLTRPERLDPRWLEAWGNLFSQVVAQLLSSPGASGTVISLLYGNEALPPETADQLILCVNPGSTSTKIGLYRGIELEGETEVHLPPDYDDSIENRCDAIVAWVEAQGLQPGDLTGIACRGGFVKPVPPGTYEVSDAMVDDLAEPRIVHASNMAIPIGLKIRERFAGDGDILVTMSDPVASDDVETVSRLTGIRRILIDGSGAHYLSHEAIHRFVCSMLGAGADELDTVGAHMGGGISIMRHVGGRATDLVNAFAGVPSANRSGNIPLDALLDAIDRQEISLPELRKYLFREGGLIDLTGTNDFRALMHFRESGATPRQREKIELVVDFLARNIAGAALKLAAFEGRVDAVILTGGLSRSGEFTGRIRRKILPYAPIVVVPGAIEHEAMVAGHLRARFMPGRKKDYVAERDELRRRRQEERDLIETEIFANPALRKKEGAPISSLDELIHRARSFVARNRAPRVAIVGAENEDAIAAAKQANEDGRYPVAKFLLVGDYYEINKLAWEYDIKVDGDNYTIVDADDPVQRAVELLGSGEADLLMKGGVKTAEIMGGTLRYLKDSGRIRKGRIYSHVGIFEIPTYPKLLMVSDAALIPNPDQKLKKKIIENAITVAGYLNIRMPKIAIISAVETRNPSVESSMLAGDLSDEYADREDCIVEGPLSLDVAMSPASAHEKHYRGRIRGNADILIMPDIEAGNVVYKSLTVSSGAFLAGAIVGAGVPIILTSRGDSARSKLASISLACLVAMKQGDLAAEPSS